MLSRHPISCTLALFCLLSQQSVDARADGNIIKHFTDSMSMMYVASEMCKETRPPEAQDYGAIIADYLEHYFSGGLQYWVLPNVERRVRSVGACGALLAERLLDYQVASVDFQQNYPNQPKPPYLVADSRITNASGSNDIVIEAPRPTPTPAPRGNIARPLGAYSAQ